MSSLAKRRFVIATRGSPLALAQADVILAQCITAFPGYEFQKRLIKTTGDKLQSASLNNPDPSLPKGLFTKELEVALLNNEADLAVHSLKDLPTELPTGLMLGAVSVRADVRDVLLCRDTAGTGAGCAEKGGLRTGVGLERLRLGAHVATSSNRRKAQLLAQRPDLNIVQVRGNVLTRLQKLATQPEMDAMVLAAAGLQRLGYETAANGWLTGQGVPDGICVNFLGLDVMLPCVGQAALGIEIRENDQKLAGICHQLDHQPTHRCVAAERALLRAMGGGCLSPIAAYAEPSEGVLWLRAVSFRDDQVRRAEGRGRLEEAESLGQRLAAELKS
jgi:hydroxymethylbilane synthase